MSLFRRATDRIRYALRRRGFKIEPLLVASRAVGGVSLQWRRDRANVRHCVLAEHRIGGKRVSFLIGDVHDVIQREHFAGRFYEEEELALIARYFPGGTLVDIGANVGNHLIYGLLFLGVEQVIAFEPNPLALPLLKANIALNGLGRQVELHELGLGDTPGTARIATPQDNLGGARLTPGDAQSAIAVAVGDDVLAGREVSFIKLDVEGMEPAVLRGLQRTIAHNRPRIFIEVDDVNRRAFDAFCQEHDYLVLERFRRYPVNENFLIGPREREGGASNGTCGALSACG